MVATDKKIKALAKFLDCDKDEAENLIEDGDYLVLTDHEAEEAAEEYIKESLWAFNADFLSGETGLPTSVFKALQPQCEDANEAILALVESGATLSDFADSAVSTDGRGHFLSPYDGEENTEGDFFIYRCN